MTDPSAPPAWLLGLIMASAVLLFIGFLFLVQGVKRAGQWLGGGQPPAAPRSGVRSTVLKSRFNRTNNGRSRSALPNAESPQRSVVQPFTDRSNVQPLAPAILANIADIPATIDEVQRLAHTIALYTKRPNKELAILEAWGETKGEGEGYKRASRLFDTAMSDVARQAAKAKAPQLAREVETA